MAIQSSNSTTTKTGGNTTSSGTSTIERTEQRVLPEEVRANLEQGKKEIDRSYGLDANGNLLEGTYPLGFNLDEYRKEQESKAQAERFKQKEAAWRNALSVVADIATASAGGNVYQRGADNVAANANKRKEEIATNLRGLETAANNALLARRNQAQAAKDSLENKYWTKYSQKQISSTNERTNDKTIEPIKTTRTANYKVVSLDGDADKKLYKITPDGSSITFSIDKEQAKDYAISVITNMSQVYRNLLLTKNRTPEQNEEMNKISTILKAAGITNVDNTYNIKSGKFNDNIILSFLMNGDIFELDADNGKITSNYGGIKKELQLNGKEKDAKPSSQKATMPGIGQQITVQTMPGVKQ